MDPTVLQRIITGFQQALEPGIGTFRPLLLFWVTTFVFLELVRVTGAVMEDGERWRHWGAFVVRTLVFVAIYWSWPSIFQTVIEDFVTAGLRFGGNQMTTRQFLDPGTLMAVGIQTAGVLKDIALANAYVTSAIYFFPFLLCWLLYLLAYAVMACNVFLTQIEVTVVLPVSLLALTLLFWGPTRGMAGGVLSYGLNVGLRFFLQAMLASLVFRLAPILTPTITSNTVFALAIERAFIMVVTAGVLAYLFWYLPARLGQMLTGTPSLSAGSFAQTVAGIAGMATGGAALLRAGGTAWQLRRQPALPAGSAAPRALPAPAPRNGPPPMPRAQALMSVLRSGAQYLAHDQSHGGPTVTP